MPGDGTGEIMRSILGFLAAVAASIMGANAAPITSFDGLEMSIELTVIDDGATAAGSFTAYLVGDTTATIGDGPEFTFFIGAPGLYSYASGYVYVDAMDDGTITAYSTSSSYTVVGNTDILPFAFSLSFAFTDPDIDVLNYERRSGCFRFRPDRLVFRFRTRQFLWQSDQL